MNDDKNEPATKEQLVQRIMVLSDQLKEGHTLFKQLQNELIA